ncbi:Por secretion system C-terminal sorting domain-containing protein [Cnuella takakiae]|uniref:Por secretion system C-terminal sorting domain-containing protein n=1 Tax=Cnuella takakiae TaxID=1302690 RepID=A0A1M4TFJ5_9BACT|nr:choice-of-anchor D domain-containing protein [Cnuella takakiae]OLY90727.1 hypothetical protein BUE76_01550 [Cnuella takakiae]SHE43155.1 Por secretion system C-terminal sorting domain-containing protein [Cnuella takakiae]
MRHLYPTRFKTNQRNNKLFLYLLNHRHLPAVFSTGRTGLCALLSVLLLTAGLLGSQTAGAQTGLLATPQVVYDNDVADGVPGIQRTVVLRNNGTAALTINAVALGGTHASQFLLGTPPVLPHTLAAGDTMRVHPSFAPATAGLKTATINVNLANGGSFQVPLRGLGVSTEPSLQALLNLLEIGVSVGDDNTSTNIIHSNTTQQKAAILGDEIAMPLFQKAGTGPVTIEPLAVFGPTKADPVVGMGWYNAGKRAGTTELFTVSNKPATNAATVQVPYSGANSFDPGSTAFGFYSRWPNFSNRMVYSEDSLNTFTGAIPHHVRVYPYIRKGVREANAYLVAFEEHITGFDFQDLIFVVRNVRPATNSSINFALTPVADAYVNGGSTGTNYGQDTLAYVRGATQATNIRHTHLRFALHEAADIKRAVLRIYGRNRGITKQGTVRIDGVDNSSWVEHGITFKNAPVSGFTKLGNHTVVAKDQYYDLDVTAYVQAQFARGRDAIFVMRDTTTLNQLFAFYTKERGLFPPQLLINSTARVVSNGALLDVENLDRFPANNRFVTSRLQKPWARKDSIYNANHDLVRMRLNNKGTGPLTIRGLQLSAPKNWTYLTLKGAAFDTTVFPITINPGSSVDLTMRFVASDSLSTAFTKQYIDSIWVVTNDIKDPRKLLYLYGLWQIRGEDKYEPDAQRTIDAFGFRTRVGFGSKDPNLGNPSKPKGDEVIFSYFVRADTLRPVTVRQMSAYHGCCTQTETFRWFLKSKTPTFNPLFKHIGLDAQSLLPRISTNGSPAYGEFSPNAPFGIKVGGKDHSDTLMNPGQKLGLRVWKVVDQDGSVIPDSYIIANDYLGTTYTNFDYNDNMYYVSNVRPEQAPLSYALLEARPSAVEFAELPVRQQDSFKLKVSNTGNTYLGGGTDPSNTISSLVITGENKGEFAAAMPMKKTLAPKESTEITVTFRPVSEGLKIADLLIYYTNGKSPLRVPLYGIAKDSGTTVKLHYRIKGGMDKDTVVAGKTWLSDKPYAFDNLEPYLNKNVKAISATDEDGLYFWEQSSNKDKTPFRYEIPLPDSSNYVVRFHFAEIYWGSPGSGLNGGAGSRVMSVQMEGKTAIANLDIVKEVGPAAALVRNVPVKVQDGKLDISFTASVNRPMVSAIEVYSFKRVLPPVVDTVIMPPLPGDTAIVTPPPPTDTVVVTPPPPVDTVIVTPPPPTDTVIVTPPPPTDTVIVTPPPPVDTVIVTPPPPVDTVVVTPPPPVDTVIVTPPPPVDTVIVTPPPPVDTVIVTPPPPVDTVIVTPPPPVDTVIVTPPPPVDTVIVTPPPPVDTVVVTPPPPVDTVVVTPPPPVDTVVVTPPPPPVDTVTAPIRAILSQLYPNPNNGSFTVSFGVVRKQTVVFRVVDGTGRRYGEERYSAQIGKNTRRIERLGMHLKAGVYYLELYYEERIKEVLKFIVL